MMRRTKRRLKSFEATPVLSLAGFGGHSSGQFPSRLPGATGGPKNVCLRGTQASKALVDAEHNNDEKAMLEVLGPDAKQIVRSGDPTEDERNRATFVNKYELMHRFVPEPGGTVLYIGAENWPFPVPLAKHGDQWYFDTEAGKHEILFRRIGYNELSAIRVCRNS
jgi:hypothetical protein